jgi:transcriptional regulator with XRE-family HTH domain
MARASYKATEKLRALRASKGLSSTQIAERLDMNVGNYSRIENAKRGVSPPTALRMARALGLRSLKNAIRLGVFKLI